MIRIDNLSFSYSAAPFIRNLSMELNNGRIIGILGPNGSGKSTCLKLCAGLLKPSSGIITVDGADLSALSPKQAAKLTSYLPQSRPLPMITVRSLVSNGRFPYLGVSRRLSAADMAAVENALELTGMQSLAARELRTLSGGERQKAYIAMLVAQGAPHMLLDEPTTFLDIGHQLELCDLLMKLRNEGRCIVTVLHDISMALDICDDVYLMHRGSMLYNGPASALISSGALETAYSVRPIPNAATRFERM